MSMNITVLRTLRGAGEPSLLNILSLSDPDGAFLDFFTTDPDKYAGQISANCV